MVRAGFDLEVELVDVVLVEDRRRAEEDLAVLAHGPLAEVAGGELLAFGARDRARRDRRRGIAREVAELARIPELEALDRAVLDEVAHLVRRAETGQLDLALVLGALQVARGGGDADRRRADDALQVRIALQQALRLLEGLLIVVVAVGRLDQLELRVLGLLELVLHELDPRVLVGRVGRGAQDRDVATAVTDLLGQQLHLAAPQVLRGGLIDEQITALRIGVGVIRDDLDALRARLVQRRHDRVGVVGRDDDRVLLLRRQRVDVADLRRSGRVRRSDALELALERLDGILAALVGDREVRVVDLLRKERDLQARLDLPTAGGRRARRRRARTTGRLLVGAVLRGPARGDGQHAGGD